MAARRSPRWTGAEVAVLREAYASGGLDAAMGLLEGRSWHSIYVKASKLGIKCSRMPDAPKCALRGPALEEAVRLREAEKWSFARIGAHFGVSESSACNAVLNALCPRNGHTPAERNTNGRLAERGVERLRWCLKKGLKGVDIQLRLGLSASRIAEERRRYNRELKERGKAPLPPPGGGQAYSGVRVPLAKRREAERLFLDGYGTKKVSQMALVSSTVATRIRNRLAKRLRRRGESLPGCDLDGARRQTKGHARHVPTELRDKLRALILERVPVRRAAALCGIGTCTAYRIRDQLAAELGGAVPPPRLPGRVRPLASEMMAQQAIPQDHLWRFRELVHAHGEAEARRILRSEIAEARRCRSFEDELELVAKGKARIAEVPRIAPQVPERTLGGNSGLALLS
jgi:hypothetical protein